MRPSHANVSHHGVSPERPDARRYYMWIHVWMFLAMCGFIAIICTTHERFEEHEPGSQW